MQRGAQNQDAFDAHITLECGGVRPKYLRQFWLYHNNNPHVFDAYFQTAKEWQREGRRRFSMDELTEQLRRHTAIETVDEEHRLKIRNQLKPYYARAMIFVRPSLGNHIMLAKLGLPHRHQKYPVPYQHSKQKHEALRVFWQTRRWPGEPEREEEE